MHGDFALFSSVCPCHLCVLASCCRVCMWSPAVRTVQRVLCRFFECCEFYEVTVCHSHQPHPTVIPSTCHRPLFMSESDSLMYIDLDTLTPLPAFRTQCGLGIGLAVCPVLNVVVTSSYDTNSLTVFALPHRITTANVLGGIGGGTGVPVGAPPCGLVPVCTLGGAGSPAPMQFKFKPPAADRDAGSKATDGYSGLLAFTGPAASRRLLVTDAGHDTVHVIDVSARTHVGYAIAPGVVVRPRGVAARGDMIAVSAWATFYETEHAVHLFQGSDTAWTPVRVLCGGFGRPGRARGQLNQPYGVRFSRDGAHVAVADWGNNRVSLFRVSNGGFAGHVATKVCSAYDMEECDNGWLVSCWGSSSVVLASHAEGKGGLRVPSGARTILRAAEPGVDFLLPSALALVPWLGLLVREEARQGRIQVFATPDVMAMSGMSENRVAWMGSVVRGVRQRMLQRGAVDNRSLHRDPESLHDTAKRRRAARTRP